MFPATVRSQAEIQSQRHKLTTSYNALLEEFSSKDLRAVGNYNLGQLIGKGSFGKVYLGTHRLIRGSKVVLKSTKKDDSHLAREVHHHRQFLHPHIARLYEVIVTESLVWLVLEYCPGDELYNYLTRNGPIDPSKVQKIFTQLVGAVSYVHSKSCVHRDLKLENILLDKHGNVKLCDFGFTREYEGKSSYLQTWCGTVCYSAPEMLKGEKYAGEKVDVWSLGIILYALLCGELPFDEDDETMTKMKILKDEPSFPDSMHGSAKNLIQTLLSKRPLLRPSLAEVLAHPWLVDHAPQQQAILDIQLPQPFSTQTEKDTLQRMHNAGADIDVVIENVLSQRCDALAGWWILLLEKEQRKELRRQRRRQERDSNGKSSRRISTASAHMNRLPHILRGIDEEGLTAPGAAPPQDDRQQHTKSPDGRLSPLSKIPIQQRPPLQETISGPSPALYAARIASGNANAAAKRRSQMTGAIITKRNSTLTLLVTDPDFHSLNAFAPNQKRKKPFLNQLAMIKSWFKDAGKRTKGSDGGIPVFKMTAPSKDGQDNGYALPVDLTLDTSSKPTTTQLNLTTGTTVPTEATDTPIVNTHQTEPPIPMTSPSRPPLTTRTSTTSSLSASQRGRHRNTSHSPAARLRHDPHLGSRKSTSSSISSVRSLSLHRVNPQHQAHSSTKYSHSKASSTSSTTSVAGGGFLSPTAPSTPGQQHRSRSPSFRPRPLSTTGLRILPPPPVSPSFQSSIRVVRMPAAQVSLNNADNTAAFANYLAITQGSAALGPPSPGLPMFARGRKKVFKGPSFGTGGGTVAERRRARRLSAEGQANAGGGVSRSGSVAGGLVGVAEDEEEEEEEMEVEEVDAFSPVVAEDGVRVEILEERAGGQFR